jgi:hypothetical protein
MRAALHLLPTVLSCAHVNKETKTSLLSTEEFFGVTISFASREKDCGEIIHVSAEIKGGPKEG